MTDSIYGVWYTTVDENLISYSGKRQTLFEFLKVLTDQEFKSNHAYLLLKEVQT